MKIIKWLKDIKFNNKMEKQRAKKGYCDLDICNVDSFIEEKLLSLLKDFKEENIGYPYGMTFKEWSNIIDKMIFLLEEMNSDDYEMHIDEDPNAYEEREAYLEKCKDEFYDLLKKYHYSLWF